MKPRSSKPQSGRTVTTRSGVDSGTGLLTMRAGGLALALLCAGMLLLGAAGSEETEQDNRKKIESMSPAERAQLKRNYEKFQKLSPEEKARYRKIHEATKNRPELNRVMRCYEDWVRTLSPWEQEDLRKAETPEERMALIRKFRAEHQNSSRWQRYRNYFEVVKILKIDSRDPVMRALFRIQPPSPELFAEMISTLEKSLPEPVKYPKSKSELTQFQRSLAVLQTATQVKRQEKGKADAELDADWPAEDVVTKVFALFEKNQYRPIRESGDMRGGSDNRRGDLFNGPDLKMIRPDRQRSVVKFVLAKALLNQWIMTVRDELDQLTVPEDQLQKFFETLSSKDKDELLKHPPEELQERLKFMYLRDHMTKEVRRSLSENTRETMQVITRMAAGAEPGRVIEGPFRQRNGGTRGGRFLNPNGRRPNGPGGRGERNREDEPEDRKPGAERPRLRDRQPDA